MADFELIVRTHIDAAHRIEDYDGKCQRLHGHRWGIEVAIWGSKLDKLNMLIDFAEVKRLVEALPLDHQYLNEVLHERNVTAEFLAKRIYDMLGPVLNKNPSDGPYLDSVTVYESPDCSVCYRGD